MTCWQHAFFILAFIAYIDGAAASLCRSLLRSDETGAEISVLINEYLHFKRLEYVHSSDYHMRGSQKRNLSPEDARAVVNEYGKKYDLEGLSVEEITQFFANSIRKKYSTIADEIKFSLVKDALLDSGTMQLQSFSRRDAIQFVNAITSPYNLNDRALSPLNAEEILNSLPSLVRRQLVIDPIIRREQNPLCCKSSPGCRTCPHNRSFLRTSKSR